MTSPVEATNHSESMVTTVTTTNLTMATYLIINGVKPELVRQGETGRGHPIGAWVFTDSERVGDLVEEFEDGRAKVEPQVFHRELTRTRRGLLDFLGVPRSGG